MVGGAGARAGGRGRATAARQALPEGPCPYGAASRRSGPMSFGLGSHARRGQCDDPYALLLTGRVMEFKTKGEVRNAPEGYMPWFDVPADAVPTTMLVTGHWSALGLRVEPAGWRWTGCLWRPPDCRSAGGSTGVSGALLARGSPRLRAIAPRAASDPRRRLPAMLASAGSGTAAGDETTTGEDGAQTFDHAFVSPTWRAPANVRRTAFRSTAPAAGPVARFPQPAVAMPVKPEQLRAVGCRARERSRRPCRH